MEMLNCQVYNSHVWFIPTEEEDTVICTLLQFQGSDIQGRFTHRGGGRVLLSSHLSQQKSGRCTLQTFCSTKTKPGWAAWNILMSPSYVSRSFIISLVGCFTGTCFPHRWDVVKEPLFIFFPYLCIYYFLSQQGYFNFWLEAANKQTA